MSEILSSNAKRFEDLNDWIEEIQREIDDPQTVTIDITLDKESTGLSQPMKLNKLGLFANLIDQLKRDRENVRKTIIDQLKSNPVNK